MKKDKPKASYVRFWKEKLERVIANDGMRIFKELSDIIIRPLNHKNDMREEPVIPKLRIGNWHYHSSKNDDGSNNGSVVTEEGFCIAKQPRYADDGEWETHAKAFTVVPDMLKYLIEEWYELNEKIMDIDKMFEKGSVVNKFPYQKKQNEYEKKFREIDKILKEAGAFSEDKW